MQAFGQDFVRDIQEARSSRATHELSARHTQEIAMQALHIHLHLPHTLAGIHQVAQASFLAEPPHSGHVLHQSAVGGHVGEGHQSGLQAVHLLGYFLQVQDRAIHGHAVDLHAIPLLQIDELQVVGHVIVIAGQDDIACFEIYGGQGLAIGIGGTAGPGDVPRLGVQHLGRFLIEDLDGGLFHAFHHIAAPLGF